MIRRVASRPCGDSSARQRMARPFDDTAAAPHGRAASTRLHDAKTARTRAAFSGVLNGVALDPRSGAGAPFSSPRIVSRRAATRAPSASARTQAHGLAAGEGRAERPSQTVAAWSTSALVSPGALAQRNTLPASRFAPRNARCCTPRPCRWWISASVTDDDSMDCAVFSTCCERPDSPRSKSWARSSGLGSEVPRGVGSIRTAVLPLGPARRLPSAAGKKLQPLGSATCTPSAGGAGVGEALPASFGVAGAGRWQAATRSAPARSVRTTS